MTRICIASSGLGHVARGIEAWADDLGKALAARGESVLLCKGAGELEESFERVVPCWTRESTGALRLLRWMPRSLGWRMGMGSGYDVEQTTFARNLIGILRSERIDVLHVQDPGVAIYVQRARERGRVSTRTILAHGTEEPLEFQQKITYLQHLAPWHLEEGRAQGVTRPTWRAIPNFIDTDAFCRQGPNLRSELELPPDAVVVLTVAAIKKHHKRIDYLLDEFSSLCEQQAGLPVYLIVAGGWEKDTDELVARGRERMGDRVRFLVRFPRERMADLYRTGDVFALCSLKEMMPIALLEATASGLPCLVSQHPVVSWMIGPGGRAIDMATPGELAGAMQELVKDSGQRCALGQQAARHCKQMFGRDSVVDRILEYYEFVMADGGGEPGQKVVARSEVETCAYSVLR